MKRIYAPTIGGLPGIIFDSGVRDLSDDIDRLDGGLSGRIAAIGDRVVSEVYPWFMWKLARNRAIALAEAGELDRLCVAGHSFGCLKALQLVADVAKHGIEVAYVGAIDPTAGYRMEVGSNVDFVDEFWASSGFPAMARAADPSGRGGGKYLYPNETPHEIHEYRSGHIALGSNSDVHDIIVSRIAELLK